MYKINEEAFKNMKELIPYMENLSEFYNADAYKKWLEVYKQYSIIDNESVGVNPTANRGIPGELFIYLFFGDIWNEEGTKINEKAEESIRNN